MNQSDADKREGEWDGEGDPCELILPSRNPPDCTQFNPFVAVLQPNI